MPKLVLIDGHSLAYRAYFALPPKMKTTKGELTHAVYGFLTTLLKIMKDEQPDYLAVAFDVGRTFRDDMYTEYKGTRQSMPDDLSYQIVRIDSLIHAFNIPSLQLPGFEADDVLGTAARLAEQQGVDTVIYTGDTDAFQLVNPHTKVVVSRRQFGDLAVYDEAAVRERYGLEPLQLADYRGLKGDTSDNIPGVPGIGEKTATELLQKYASLEGIYAHLEEITAKRAREALAANREKAFLSRKLAVIVRDAPLTFDLQACRVNEYNPESVKQILRELEIHSLMDKLPQPVAGADGKALEAQTAEAVEAAEAPVPSAGAQAVALDYQTVQDEAAFKKMLTRLRKAKAIAVDTETTGPDAFNSELVGISLSIKNGQAWYIAIGHRAAEQADMLSSAESQADDYRCLSLETVRAELAPLFADPKIAKYGHNIKFDALVLAAHGMPLEGITFDTMVGAFLADPGSRQLGLKTLGFVRLGREMQDIVTLIGKGKDQITMAQVPVSKASPYACADAEVTHSLVGILTPELKEKNAWSLFTEIEMPLVPVLIGMEQAGVLLDVEFLGHMHKDLEKRLRAIERSIYKAVGHEFNINSTQQLGKVLFEELKLDASGAGKTKAGGYSTAVGVLEQLQGAHAVVDMVLEYRQLDKLQSTYVETLPALVSRKDGRLHTSYNQTGAVTGRISSSDPNLQNIPIRTELGAAGAAGVHRAAGQEAAGRRLFAGRAAHPGAPVAGPRSARGVRARRGRAQGHRGGDLRRAAGRGHAEHARHREDHQLRHRVRRQRLRAGGAHGAVDAGGAAVHPELFREVSGRQEIPGRHQRDGAHQRLRRDAAGPPPLLPRAPVTRRELLDACRRRAHGDQRARAGHQRRHHEDRDDPAVRGHAEKEAEEPHDPAGARRARLRGAG